MSDHPFTATGLPRISPSDQLQISSLTVARQRGILTRFPVFAQWQRRAYRKKLKEPEKPVKGIYWETCVEVKSKSKLAIAQPILQSWMALSAKGASTRNPCPFAVRNRRPETTSTSSSSSSALAPRASQLPRNLPRPGTPSSFSRPETASADGCLRDTTRIPCFP